MSTRARSHRLRPPLLAALLAALLATPGPSVPVAAQAASSVPCASPSPSASPGPDAPEVMPEDFRLALFDSVWGTVNDGYLDPEFGGVDWAAVGEEYAPYVLQTENAYEVYALLEEMVGLLEDPYTRFLSAPLLEAAANQDPTYGGIGALMKSNTALTEGEGLSVLYVFAGGAAEEAGIQSRDRILAVGDDPCPSVDKIRGPVGTTIVLQVASPGQPPRSVSLERKRIDPIIQPAAKRLEGGPDIGYLRLLSLSGQDTLTAAQAALATFLDEGPLHGLVMDLRSSNVGAPGVVSGILGEFVSGKVGTLVTRDGEAPLEITPADLLTRLASVAVVVLVDEATEGEAERLAAILQSAGRARVVGKTTPGLTQGIQNVDLPEGSILQLVVAGLTLPDGTRLEAHGVVPDVEVDEDWLTYPEAQDPFILSALGLLQGHQGGQTAE